MSVTTINTGEHVVVDLKPSQSTQNANLLNINGKRFRITHLQIRVSKESEWQDIDPADIDMGQIAQQCAQIYQKLKPGETASKFTLELEKVEPSTTFFQRVFSKPPLPQLQPKRLESTTQAGQTSVLNTEDYEPADLLPIFPHVQVLDRLTNPLFENPKYLAPKKKRISSAPAPQTASPVIDAGSRGNRCAALSIIERELKSPGNNADAIASRHGLASYLPIDWKQKSDLRDVLASALVKKAADQIRHNPAFRQPVQAHQPINSPCWDIILIALREYKKAHQQSQLKVDQDHFTNEEREDLVNAYANLISQDGEMLDLPFFMALEIPFIILQKEGDQFKIYALSHNFKVELNLESPDSRLPLENISIVLYDGAQHYQAIVDKPEHKLDDLIKQDIENRFTNVRIEMEAARRDDSKKVNTARRIVEFLKFYPFGRARLLQLAGLPASDLQNLTDEQLADSLVGLEPNLS